MPRSDNVHNRKYIWKSFELNYPGCLPIKILQNGENPELLFYSGIHGDEHSVTEPLRLILTDILKKDKKSIGSCIFIPKIHEEALKQNSRCFIDETGCKHDLNRKFKHQDHLGNEYSVPLPDHLGYPKASQLIKVISLFPEISYVFSFHTDNEPKTKQLGQNNKIIDVDNGAYIYDIPYYEMGKDENQKETQNIIDNCMQDLRSQCKENGINMLDGWDDIDDPDLRNYVHHGYVRTPVSNGVDGSLESYLAELGRLGVIKVKRSFSFETPGWISTEIKIKYINSVFSTFIIPFLKNIKDIDSVNTILL